MILASVLAPTSVSRSRYGLPYAAATASATSLGKPGREAGPREVHEHRRPGADRLGDVEDAHELTLLQPDDVDHEVRQPIRIQLEHEIAWQRFERVPDRASGVGLGAGVDEPEHGACPISDGRDRQDALAVGARRQQTDETMLHRTVAHAHTRPSRTAVDRRHGLAPRDDDRTVRCVRLGRRRVDLVIGTELPELGAVANDEPVVDPVVHRGAEEHEVLGRQPFQDRVVLAERRHSITHLGEVVHDEVDVGDRRECIGFERGRGRLVAVVDLDLRPRLCRSGVMPDTGHDTAVVPGHVEHRMHHQMDVETVALDDHASRVDEERCVVGDHVQDRARRP